MPPRGVKTGSKLARQYEHIKDSGRRRGMSTGRAEEMAARTVNKERAESNDSSSTSSRRSRSSHSRSTSSSGRGSRARTTSTKKK